jgi:hypothetical protein
MNRFMKRHGVLAQILIDRSITRGNENAGKDIALRQG